MARLPRPARLTCAAVLCALAFAAPGAQAAPETQTEQAAPKTQTEQAAPIAQAEQAAPDAQAEPTAPDTQAERYRLSVVPTTSFNSDEGFGFGGVGTLYHLKNGLDPYKDALTLNLYISTKLVQNHRIRWDVLNFMDLPLRMFFSAGYYVTLAQNYCGVGNSVTCGEAEARDAAREAGLDVGTDAYTTFVDRYYKLRYMRPYGEVLARYRLWNKPHRLELMGGWRGAYQQYGTFGKDGAYPGSLYDTHFPQNQNGLTSMLHGGIVLDNRDQETNPNTGYVWEASLRGAIGSTWDYAGLNTSLATFAPVHGRTDLIWANRSIVDILVGDAPIEEQSRLGGTVEVFAFGGRAVGRGIRERRYIGKVKLMHQSELRWTFAHTTLWGEDFDFGLEAVADIAWIGASLTDVGGDPARVLVGTGGGLRIVWNKNFVVRFEGATGPAERYGLSIYTPVGNAF